MTIANAVFPLRIPADHPSLPGHFPGQPIVPGVLLLDAVAEALYTSRGHRLTQVVEAKFLSPLLPEQVAELRLTDHGGRVLFEIRFEDRCLARGTVRGEP
ncbi:MAG TPA: hydroxymyristoyl-ACP dehydratase [Dyella sp.]|uniref:hydroxymyristoyl-ACP dehydratase n=1 Tax=Dyella sp. TaxID=1869338 RepID=UPI002F92F6A3